jgi:hydrogenase nickel incorporation protein HypA/HybF
MHELSIAMGIVKIAEDACKKAKAKQVDVIELQIGELSGVEASSLDFVWPMAVQDTKLACAEKAIDWVEGKAKCLECGNVFEIHSLYDGCPSCNSYFKDITAGKELKVKSLVIS